MSLETISANLTEEYLHEIVKKAGGVKYLSWEFEGAAGKKGDGYLSDVFKVVVRGVNDKDVEFDVHLIIKATPKSAARRATFRSSDFFRNEINFYEIVLKKMLEFQAVKKNVMNPFNEIATYFSSYRDSENAFLALENLNPYGYFTTTRQQSMDVHLCRLIMQTLGRFHGLSFVIRDQSPQLFEEITSVLEETYYAQHLKSWYNDFINIQIDVALDAVSKTYGGTAIEEHAKKFLSDGSLYDKMVKLTHTRNRFSIIGHGDCWTPNFCIYSTKLNGVDIPVKAKMIDFQLSRYASPAIDISFFIYSCTTEELRAQYYDDLLRTYHTSLCDLIRDFGSNADYLFPFSALENEMKLSARFGAGMAIESIPFSLLDDHETADMDQITGDVAVPITSIWIIKRLEDECERKRLADVFKHATERGYLN